MNKVNIDGISLSDLIKNAADQIRIAAMDAKNSKKDAVMQFEKCELELAVTLENAGGGKINVFFMSANLAAKESAISKIKLVFGPADGTPPSAMWSSSEINVDSHDDDPPSED